MSEAETSPAWEPWTSETSPASGLFVSDCGEGAPVLLVHGQPGLATDFSAVTALLEDDHRVLAPDRPGYGGSGDTPRTMRENADALAILLEERSAAPATVVGHSYGGGVAILLAAQRPELVAGLVLVASVGNLQSVNLFDRVLAAPVVGPEVTAAWLFAVGRVLPRLRWPAGAGPAGIFDRLRVNLPELSQTDPTGSGRRIWRSFLLEQRALLREIGDVERCLSRVHAPTEVLAGEWDMVVPASAAAGLAAAIPGAHLVVLGRVGHFLTRDASETVAASVRAAEARAGVPRRATP